MPLKSFFGGIKNKNVSSNGGKESKDDKEMRGQRVKVDSFSVTIDSKIAEGGFAIVYKVTTDERRSRVMALKRQFVADDDLHQLQACKRECEIVRTFGPHKNVITFYAASMKTHSSGVRDYLLLTDFYQSSVLALMNSRISSNTWLSVDEVLAITTDMCEAVSCLHHASVPIWHADLKVENILIDSGKPPNYILCDFGSANTTTLTTRLQSHAEVEEHILKYTTLAYRAPEMIDLFAGHEIGIATDIWALGVMVFKLCYFTLPFGESTLAIQNGTFTFPERPEFPKEIKSLIRYMLEPNVKYRPNIAQLSAAAFEIRGRTNVVKNVHNSALPTLDQLSALLSYHERGCTSEEEHPLAVSSQTTVPTDTGTLIDDKPLPTTPRGEPVATSIAPRIRPKATNAAQQMQASPLLNRASTHRQTLGNSRNSLATADRPQAATTITHSSSFTKPTDLGFTDLTDEHIELARSSKSLVPSSVDGRFERTASNTSSTSQHRRNYSDATGLKFAPDDVTPTAVDLTRTPVKASKPQPVITAPRVPDWNPFNDAPFVEGTAEIFAKKAPVVRDEKAHMIFNPAENHGQRHRSSLIGAPIMETDPFGAAPFRAYSNARAPQTQACKTQGQPCQSSSSSQLTLRDGSSNGSLTDTQQQYGGQAHSPPDRVVEPSLQPTRSRYRQLHDGQAADISLPSNASIDEDTSSSDSDNAPHPPAVHAYIPKHGREDSSDEGTARRHAGDAVMRDRSLDEDNLQADDDDSSDHGAPPVPRHRDRGSVKRGAVNTSFHEGHDESN